MATYAIGDVQGCYAELRTLLEKIHFNANRDQLWFVGDLVNRGPASLETLQYVCDLGDSAKVVLGNHDLHLIACAYGARTPREGDTLDVLLHHSESPTLIRWLQAKPLLLDDASLGFCMTHAGIPHIWSLEKAKALADEACQMIQRQPHDQFGRFFSNEPSLWSDTLTGSERTCCVINYLTRMRFIQPDGRLNFTCKGVPSDPPLSASPWFHHPSPAQQERCLLFGHWAALNGVTIDRKIFGIDTGCVWGQQLTALRLDDLTHHSTQADCAQ